jgi:xanthine/CO dehydrogenase XdhC/CoxF family maturation factor
MSEAQRIVALSHRALARGDRLCLATVVHVEGSAYRKPGARMLITSTGERAGTISGGCLETEVSRKAWWLTANGARIERYSSFADEDGGMPYGLGCGGTVSLLLEQGAPVHAVLAALDRVLTTSQPAIIITALGHLAGEPTEARTPHGTLAVLALPSPQAPSPVLYDLPDDWELLYLRPEAHPGPSPGSTPTNSSNATNNMQAAHTPNPTHPPKLAAAARLALTQRRSSLLTSRFLPCPESQQTHPADAPAYFVEYLAPPPSVTIFGAGDDAQPIVELAHTLGWRVTIADGRAHLARRDRFPHAAEVRVLNYADPALRAACGMPRDTAPPSEPSSTHPWPPANAAHPPSALPDALLSDDLAIILTHSYQQDRALLAALLPRRLRYLGILGPRHRTQRLLSEIAPSLGLSLDEAFARLHSPIGLDLGVGDPATVALSIVAEIQAVLHAREVHIGRPGEPLPLLLAGD